MFDKDFTDLLSAFAAHRVKYLVIGGYAAPFIALPDLIASKLAAGRPQDLADVAALRAATQNEA